MDSIQTILSNPYQVIISLIALMYVIKEVYKGYCFWKERADGYHQRESKKEDFEKQVNDIAVTSEKHTRSLGAISEALKEINMRFVTFEKDRGDELEVMQHNNRDMIQKIEDERKLDTIANSRAWLYQLYDQLKDKPSLTPSEYETFDALAERYLQAGGNNVFEEKIIPYIREKPIDDKQI